MQHEALCARIRALEADVKEIESFSCGLLHDMRPMLRAIDGYAWMLEQDHVERLDEEACRYVRLIRERTQSMDRLLEDLFVYARIGAQPANIAEVDMRQLVLDASRHVLDDGRGKPLQFIVHPLPRAHGDQHLLHRALVNLIGNAVKYSSKVVRPRIEIEGWEEGAEALYAVTDNGAGFDMQFAKKLFGLFQRLHGKTEFPGAGIGLAIVERVITGHGGRVWAEGEPGKGATFYFTLPRAEISA